MKHRPFLVLALLIAAAALMQAAFVPASTPEDFKGNTPPGTVCTVCGPIPTGVCELPVSSPAADPGVSAPPLIESAGTR